MSSGCLRRTCSVCPALLIGYSGLERAASQLRRAPTNALMLTTRMLYAEGVLDGILYAHTRIHR